MTHFICKTCGAQFADSRGAPASCAICEDERQYVGANGQQWTTLAELQAEYHNVIKPAAVGMTGIGTYPKFAIGQRALLVQTAEGNVLWDCVSLIDETTVAAVNALGGVRAIAGSHPHLYGSMIEWSRAFDAPVYLHAANRRWVMRPDEAISYWDGESKALWDGMTLIRCGGHFKGSTVLHWPDGADGKGALLTGDTIQVASDRRWVSFMRSYPNMIPLNAAAVRGIVAALEPYDFEVLYGGWWEKVVIWDAKTAVARSAERYARAIA